MSVSTISIQTTEAKANGDPSYGSVVVRERVETTPNLVEHLLQTKTSEHTRRAYRKDIQDFFEFRYGSDLDPDLVAEFALLSPERAAFALAAFRHHLEERKMAPATVNRKIAAVQSLLATASRAGLRDGNGRAPVALRRAEPLKRTEGLSGEDVVRLLSAPDTSTLKGKRDRALLLLMIENALRSAELRALRMLDLDLTARLLRVGGTGRAGRMIHLSERTAKALGYYLSALDGPASGSAPLFRSLHPGGKSEPLTSDGLYKVLAEVATRAGVQAVVNPRVLRYTSIVTAVEATNGDRAVVRRFSGLARTGAVARYGQASSTTREEPLPVLAVARTASEQTEGALKKAA